MSSIIFLVTLGRLIGVFMYLALQASNFHDEYYFSRCIVISK
jgi:hypothetical protein